MSVNIVAVMAKYPELAKVKTRLAATIGDKKALEVYKLLLENISLQCKPIKNSSYLLACFLTPDNFIDKFSSEYNFFSFITAQKGNNLGQRMYNAFDTIASNSKAEKIILIGADIPDLNRDIIENAFEALTSNDLVIGPTDDGGYYLIGMKKIHSEIFENISWGTSKVLEETLSVCKQNSLSYQLLQTLSDLDIEEDLKSFPNILKKMQ